jgi:hypothetical protein
LTTNLASKPLVSAELFERIQVLLAKHHETFTFKHSHANDFLFNGILFCGKCGSRFYLKNDFRCHQPATYYCSSFRTKRGTCGVSRYPAQLVDDTLFDICAIEFKKKEWVERVKAAALNSDQAKERRDELAAAQERLNSLEKKKAKAQRLYMADDSDETAFNLVMVIKRDIAESKLRLATAKADAEPFGTDDASEIAQVISARWKHPEKWTFEERKKAIQETIERIILSTDGRSTLVIRGGLPIPAGTWYADFSESKEHANRVKLS